jgi:hypothetical protein
LLVRSPRSRRLLGLLQRFGYAVREVGADELEVADGSPEELRELARFFRVPVQQFGER